MRAIASFASLLLLLVVVLDLERWSKSAEQELLEREAKQSAAAIRIFSTGHGLDPSRSWQLSLPQGIYVDSEYFTMTPAQSGLRVLTLAPNGEHPTLENYKFERGAAEVGRFANMLAKVPVDTVLAMGVVRLLVPGQDQEKRREEVNRLFRGLGAQAEPARSAAPSYAFLCVRRPQGFVPIAESFSRTRGVSLNFHLDADRSIYDERSLVTLIDNRVQRPLGRRGDPGAGGRVASGPVNSGPADSGPVLTPRVFKKVSFPAVEVQAQPNRPGSLRWRTDEFAQAQRKHGFGTFQANVALLWQPQEALEGVRLELFVNGRPMAQRVILKDRSVTDRWHAWEVLLDLAPDERIEAVEIQAHHIGDPKGPKARVVVGDPLLQFGSVSSISAP